jgi:large subunit ribosomal protein L25
MELTVTKRDSKKSPKALRQEGMLPAVIYGRKEESTPIAVDRKVFEKLFHTAGESTVITIKGLGDEKDALIHEVTVDPVTGALVHADFYAIAKGQTVTVSIPVEFDGEAAAVKNGVGTLVKVIHEIEIECQPRDLPKEIRVDVTRLATLEDKITVADIAFPASAKVSANPEDVIAMIAEVKEEPVEEVAPATDLSAIEISEERGKKEEEGEAGAAPSAEKKE